MNHSKSVKKISRESWQYLWIKIIAMLKSMQNLQYKFKAVEKIVLPLLWYSLKKNCTHVWPVSDENLKSEGVRRDCGHWICNVTKDSGGYDQATCVRVEEVNGCFSQTDGSLLFSEGEQAAMPLHEAPAQVKKNIALSSFWQDGNSEYENLFPCCKQQSLYCIVPDL